MSEIFKFLKKNTLGVAVALGVCSFLYEGLIKPSSHFTLTKSAGILIFLIAITSRYRSNSAKQEKLPKKEYIVNRDILKDYLKYRLYFLPVILILFLLFHYSIIDRYTSFFFFGLFIFDIIQGYYRYQNRILYLSDLNKKGLTEIDIINTEFIKKWEEHRERGLIKYCLIDGGIIAGALLSLLVSLIGFFILSRNNKIPFADGPGEIFQFIGITYLIGAVIGVISYRITWYFNQNRFARLTSPLH